jgi:DNA polymerase IV
MLSSYPRAILHVDGDAFFASCEQAVHPEYRGRPLVTGKERRIITAASYEAKALGISRGTPLWEAKKICPELIIASSDYAMYARFSRRLFSIIKRFTPFVEAYSIDEAFAELTGFDRPNHEPYETLALRLQDTIKQELGITVSVGLSISKVLAKIASKWKKPSGATFIPSEYIRDFLASYPIEKVWGIGPSATFRCHRFGIRTALDLSQKSPGFIRDHFAKPQHDIWEELNGNSVLPINYEGHEDPKSISTFRTLDAPSTQKNFLFSHLLKNLEGACHKARHHHLATRKLFLVLRTQEFRHHGCELDLERASAYPSEMSHLLHQGFENVFRPGTLYRATGVTLAHLLPQDTFQASLFEAPHKITKWQNAYAAVDRLNEKFGRRRIHLATSLETPSKKQAAPPTPDNHRPPPLPFLTSPS